MYLHPHMSYNQIKAALNAGKSIMYADLEHNNSTSESIAILLGEKPKAKADVNDKLTARPAKVGIAEPGAVDTAHDPMYYKKYKVTK